MRLRLLVLCAAMACKTDTPVDADDVVESPPDTDVADDSDTPVVDDTDTSLQLLGVPAELEQSGVIVCANPALRASRPGFALRAARQPLGEGEFYLVGGAAVVADLTGDGVMDVFMPGYHAHQLHVQHPGPDFSDEFEERMPGVDLSLSTGVSIVDLEGDGDLDLYVTRWERPNVLLVNDGTGHFTDGTEAAGILSVPRRYQSSVWGDLDRDGDLDLVIGGYGPEPEDAHGPLEGFEVGDPSEVWRNNGDGTFTDISDILPAVIHDAHTFTVAFHDLDLDGWDELLFINDFGWNRPSRIFWNRPEGLVMDDGSAGFDLPFAGMGLAVADLNGDEVPDFVQSSWKEISLLASAAGSWWESALAAGIWPDHEGPPTQVFGWGTELADLDNDGDDDLMVNYGWWDWYGPNYHQQDATFLQTGPMVFQDRAAEWRMDDMGVSRGIVTIDMNGDGFIDVLKRILDDRAPMYLSNCGAEGWLRVRATQPGPNRQAIGARVRVVKGSKVWSKQIHAGGTGMYSAYQPEVHVGLGMIDKVDVVEVVWPGGEVTTIKNVDTRQVLTVKRQ